MSIIRLFYQLIKNHKAGLLISLLFSVLSILSSVALFGLSAYIISFCSFQPSIAEISVAVVGVRFFGISRGVFRYFERLVSHNTTFQLLGKLRVWLYEKIEATSKYEYMQMNKEDVFAHLIDDIEILQEFCLRTLTPFIVALVVGIIGFFMLISFDIRLAIGFIVLYILCVLVTPILIWYLSNGLYKKIVIDKNQWKIKLLDYFEGLAEIIGCSATDQWDAELQQAMDKTIRNQHQAATWRSLSNGLTTLFMNLAMVICLGIGNFLVNTGALNSVYIAVIVLAVSALFEGTIGIPQMLQKLQQSKAAADRIYSLADKAYLEPSESEIGTASPEIILDNVCYQYPNQQSDAISDFNIKLQAGKKIAIVGESGSGKSTVGYLMLGWLKHTLGNTKNCDSNLFSVVNQHVHFFNTTIRNNLMIAAPAASEADLNEALKRVQLIDFIKGLPYGLDTEIGEAGMKLSGGQRQRLAIARALLYNRSFLLLDEPTAGLDLNTERILMSELLSSLQNKGLLLITHRLVALDQMDEILVIRAGRVIERGVHKQLILNKGYYYDMLMLQNSTIQL